MKHVIRKVYWEPWWITKAGSMDVHNIVSRKLAEGIDPEKATKHAEQRPDTDLFGEPMPQMRIDQGVAIIPVKGTIFKGAANIEKISGATSPEDIRSDLEAAARNGRVRSILLDINSPGGTVTGIRELAERIGEIDDDQSLPNVFAFTDDTMASAAYKLAAPASAIFVAPTAQVGSVGTRMEVVNFVGQLEQLGIAVEVFTSGPFKAMGHEATQLTDEQREFIQEQVDRLGQQFQDFVLENRGDMEINDLQGQLFMGDQAIEKNFADERADTLENVLTRI